MDGEAGGQLNGAALERIRKRVRQQTQEKGSQS